MKKFVSLLLVFCMVLSLSVTAFAEHKCDCGHSPVIYLPGMGETIYDYTDETPLRIYAPDESLVKQAIPNIVMAVLALLTHQNRLFATLAMRAAYQMLGLAICDKEGVPVRDSGVQKRPLPTSGVHGQYRSGAGDYTYYYDWRVDPIDSAKGLHEWVERVKELTGHDKVSFAAHSMGNTVVASYLYLYGSDDVDKIVCISPAYKGLSIMGSLLSGEADIKNKDEEVELFALDMLGNSEQDMKLKTLVKVCYRLKVVRGLLHFLQRTLDSQFERVFDECLREMFAHMRGVWAFVPDEYYERAKAYSFGDDTSYSKLIAYIDDYHYNVQVKLEQLLQKAMDNGVEVMIISGYGLSSMPLSATHTVQSDSLIDTRLMSIGAVCAPYGKTLPASHVQAVQDGHNHISPENLVDASTCAFPEITWFVRDQTHWVSPANCTPMLKWFFAQDGQVTVHDDEDHPQFMLQNGEGRLLPVIE